MEFFTPAKQKQPPVDPDDLTNKAYVDAVAGGRSIAGIPGLQARLDSIAAGIAGKMPIAPNDGKKYAGKGATWVEMAAPPPYWERHYTHLNPFTIPSAGLIRRKSSWQSTYQIPGFRIIINGVTHPINLISQTSIGGGFYSFNYDSGEIPVNAGDIIQVLPIMVDDSGASLSWFEYHAY